MVSHNVPRATRPRTQEQREKDLDRIGRYRDLEQQIRRRVATSQYDVETYGLSSKLLRLNPEYYTVWNIRRRCLNSLVFSLPSDANDKRDWTADQARGGDGGVGCHISDDQQNDEETIRSELVFTVPLLIEFPKCYWIWKYRLWMLQQAIQRLPLAAARTVWEEELGLVGKMLHKDCRNFHAWGYRRHVVSQLESPSLHGKTMVEAEFTYSTKMIHMDLSNFSAWHNRSRLIPRLLNERNADELARKRFLDEEFEIVHGALNVGPEDQSLWYYHQFLVHAVRNATGDGPIVSKLLVEERLRYLNNEIDFVQELLEDYSGVKWIYEALVEYTLAADHATNNELQQANKTLLIGWLGRLKELDSKRHGRWLELEKTIGIPS